MYHVRIKNFYVFQATERRLQNEISTLDEKLRILLKHQAELEKDAEYMKSILAEAV